MSDPGQLGEAASEALQEAIALALLVGRGMDLRTEVEAFQAAASTYVAAQAAFTIACNEAIQTDPDGLKRTVRHYADGFIVE